MREFTRGPWVILHDNGVNTIVPAMREGVVADLIENNADACLIAMAPDLLAELSDLIRWLEANERHFEGEFIMDEVLRDSRDIIARAEGRS